MIYEDRVIYYRSHISHDFVNFINLHVEGNTEIYQVAIPTPSIKQINRKLISVEFNSFESESQIQGEYK